LVVARVLPVLSRPCAPSHGCPSGTGSRPTRLPLQLVPPARLVSPPFAKGGMGGFFGSSCLFCLCTLVPARASDPIRWHRGLCPLCERLVLRNLGEGGCEQERLPLTSAYLAPVSPRAPSSVYAPVSVSCLSCCSCPCSSPKSSAGGPDKGRRAFSPGRRAYSPLFVRASIPYLKLPANVSARKRVSPHPSLHNRRLPYPFPEATRDAFCPLYKRGSRGGFFSMSCNLGLFVQGTTTEPKTKPLKTGRSPLPPRPDSTLRGYFPVPLRQPIAARAKKLARRAGTSLCQTSSAHPRLLWRAGHAESTATPPSSPRPTLVPRTQIPPNYPISHPIIAPPQPPLQIS